MTAKVELLTPSGGKVILDPTDTAVDRTLTLPALAGTVFNQGNVVGTVSESSGVPTGAIIERGSNANGQFVKYADGTMICTKTVTFTTAVNTAFGNVFISSAEDLGAFPATFSVVPHAISVAHLSSSGRAAWLMTSQEASVTAFNDETYFVRGSSDASEVHSIKAMAVGRWF